MNIYSITNHPTGFYVYAYLREDGTYYYIGKGIAGRAWSHAKRERVHAPIDPERIIVIAHRLSESESLLLEIKLIQELGRKIFNTGLLQNTTAGGSGGKTVSS